MTKQELLDEIKDRIVYRTNRGGTWYRTVAEVIFCGKTFTEIHATKVGACQKVVASVEAWLKKQAAEQKNMQLEQQDRDKLQQYLAGLTK